MTLTQEDWHQLKRIVGDLLDTKLEEQSTRFDGKLEPEVVALLS